MIVKKKIVKIILGLLIDCVIIYCLFKGVIAFHYNISAVAYPEINKILYFALIVVFYFVFAWFNRWITPGIKLMTERKKGKNTSEMSAKKIVLATFLDWFLVFSFMLIINLVLRQFVFINTIVLFTIVAFLYYIVSYLTVQQTFGYCFCNIELVSKQENTHWLVVVIKRELFKYGLGAWLPLGLYYIVFKVELFYFAHILLFLVFNIMVLLFYYTAKGEAWWNTIGKTQTQQKNSSVKFKYLFHIGFIAFIGLIFLIFLLHNNINNSSTDKLLGFNIPFKRIEYPNNNQVKPYTTFLKKHTQNPKEYLLSLFDKYDIVILCEHLHTEDTQWDFIYDVVTDTQFVGKVGHIFTEYGRAKDQAKVYSFMQTSFSDSISLAKAAATLMCYYSGNFYFFMQKLYTFNQTLPDSLQVQEHFTDVSGWNYLYYAYSDTLLNNRSKTLRYYRDSLMAQAVIDWHEQTGGKCLVITNYRHAFALKDSITSTELYDNQAQYIYNKLPEVTANVLIHGSNFNGIYQTPIQHGLWNRVMRNNGNIPVGFDFENSPFGKDKFDMYMPVPRNIFNCLYQDAFTGYVFYKPEEEYTHSEPHYRKYAAEKEYEWALQHQLIDSIQGKKLVNEYKNTGGKYKNTYLKVLYLNLYHFIDLLLWGLWAVIVFLIMVGSFLRNVYII